MKTNEITFYDIDNEEMVNFWYNLISAEPIMDSGKKEDWVGETIYQIHYKNNLVGFIAYSRWKNAYCLSCIYILEPYRHQEIATTAIRKLAYQLKSKTNGFYGFVHKDNVNAIKTYRKLGFKYLNKARSGYIYDSPNDDCVVTDDGFYEFGKVLV